MSISTEISRIKAAKESLKRAINAKGGTLSDELIDDYAAAVSALPSGGSDIDLSGVTVTADKLLAGVVAVDGLGSKVTGTIPEVTASRTDNTVNVPAGFHAEAKSFPVFSGADVSGVTVTASDMLKGKIAVGSDGQQIVGTIPDSEIQFGEIVGDYKTSKKLEISKGYLAEDFVLDYNEAYPELTATADDIRTGKTAIAIREGESGNFLYGEVTGTLEEASGGGGEFYKCAAVYGPYDVETVVISGCPAADANGEYLPTDQTTSDWEGKEYPIYANGKGWYYGYSEFGGWGITQDINNGLNYQGQVGGGEWYDWNDAMPVSGMTGVNGTATLDTDVPKTWDGHKAVLTNGVYIFEDAVTEGLTYSDNKPQKYGIYNDGATMKLDWIIQDYPTIGLSFFASLTDDLTLAETGQTLTVSGAQKATVDDVSCAKFFGADNYSKVECQTSLNIIDGHNYTVAFGFRVDSDQDGGWIMGIGSWNTTAYKVMFLVSENSGKWYGLIQNGNSDTATACSFEIERDKWNYVVVTKNPKTRNVTVWLNRAVVGTFSTDFHMANEGVRLGYNGNDFGKGYLNNVMVYNRELTEAEIGQLVDKFSQTA